MTIISIKSGKIRGTILKTWKNNEFFAFRGIPFATPPVGELRFKDPVPVTPWNETLDCTKDGPMCPQPRKTSEETSEDCLRINVYTKSMSTNKNELKPVLVYIHGGGLYVGSSASTDNGEPEYMMEQDVVLVTFNYRLGFLGFFNLGTKEYPGNAGFKDQSLALRWVRDNIEAFGGDPGRVTLIGNSAGALCVLLHTVSPMSQGLFHQAIIASGGINFQTDVKYDQKYLIERQARTFGITYTSDEGLVEAFKKVPVEKFVETLYSNFEFGHDNPIFLWSYVIEHDFGQERFLIEDPRKSLVNGRFNKIPIMAGVTANELTTSAVSILQDPALSEKFMVNIDKIAPVCFGYESNSKSKVITETLVHEYNLPNKFSLESTLEPLSQLFSDAMIGYASHCASNLFRVYQPVFRYKFSYIGRYSFLCFPDDKTPYGAEHCDDFIYLFVNRRYVPVFTKNDPEAQMIDLLTWFVGNFCKYGDPNGPKGGPWKKNTAQDGFYLDINKECELKQHLFQNRYSIWEKLFPLNDFKE